MLNSKNIDISTVNQSLTRMLEKKISFHSSSMDAENYNMQALDYMYTGALHFPMVYDLTTSSYRFVKEQHSHLVYTITKWLSCDLQLDCRFIGADHKDHIEGPVFRRKVAETEVTLSVILHGANTAEVAVLEELFKSL